MEELRGYERELARVQRLESLGLVAGGIAHDFNNLLAGMAGQLSLLADHPDLPPHLRANTLAAAEAGLRGRGLTRQLLTFARGGAPVRRVASLEAVVRDAVELVMTGKSAECKLAVAKGLHAVEVDTDQMTQVFGNLLINALQAMPDGGVVHVTCANVEADDEMTVRVTVRDEGPGIDPDAMERLFEPYFTTKSEGSGLGLATAYSIVRRHGGTLTAESTPGEGAAFHVSLPATSEQPAEKPPPPARKRSPRPASSSWTTTVP